MASFNLAFAVTLKHEGGYANHQTDRGGETYKGIARNRHPDWPGWQQIDSHFATGADRHALTHLPGLPTLVMDFYKVDFWDKLRATELNSQFVADELFDTAVNMGPARSVKMLQKSINLLGRIGGELKEDGIIGPATLKAANELIDQGKELSIVKAQNGLQFCRYAKIIKRDPSQRVFFRGWLRRV